MAHFAKLNKQGFVIAVLPVDDEVITDPDTNTEIEQLGIDYLTEWSGGHQWWAKTSYSTMRGVHTNGGTPFRKNFAKLGGTYDAVRDMFIDPKLKTSDILDEDTGSWVDSGMVTPNEQNGPTQTETGVPEVSALENGYWDWDPNAKTWIIKN